jgi:hypothetical protein
MELEQLKDLLLANVGAGRHVPRCLQVVEDPAARFVGFGTTNAREVLGLWRIREQTLLEAGVVAEGLTKALGALGALGHSRPVQVFAFSTEQDLAWVFVSAQDQGLVGCFVKSKRGTLGGGPVAPPAGPDLGSGPRQ